MNRSKLNLVQLISLLCVFVGVVLKFSDVKYAEYIYTTGVVGLFFLQIIYAIKTKKAPLQTKRIASLMFLATSILGVGAYFMFLNNDYWAVSVLIYALIAIFLSFRGGKKKRTTRK